ncbi:MAG TPA: hypothetical protein VF081_06650 [Solirubrobacterales bacterium]
MSERGGASFPGGNGKIAFSNGQSYFSQSIYSVNADGSSPVGLTSGTNDYWPSYSPDGAKVTFNRERNVMVMNADGTGLAQIATGSKSENSTNKWESNFDDPRSSKIIPEVKIVTRTRVGKSFYGPEFLPGGAQLAVSEAVFNRTQVEVCAVEEAGDTECLDYEEPGAYFYYESDCDLCFQHIVTLSATTGALAAVVTPAIDGVTDYSPAVAADGKVAFTRYGGTAGSSGVFVAPSPGAPPSQLTAGYGNYTPDFSPDSSKLIFSHEGKEFGVIGVGGGAITLIPMPPKPPGTFEYVELPRFSPDGTQIAFFKSRYQPSVGEENGVFVMASNGVGPHRITSGFDPTWQPVPPPPPVPATGSKKHKGKLKLNKKGQAVIGTITCGSSPCALKVSSALLSVKETSSSGQAKGDKGKSSAAASKKKARAKKYKMKATAPKTLAPGAKGKVTITVKGKALEALRKALKGDASVKVKVTEALGTKTITLAATLSPPKAEKKKSKGKGKKKGH